MSDSGLFRLVVEAIIEKEDKILLMKRSPERDHAPNEWETLSGRMNQGETFEQAVYREVLEETGFEVAIVKPIDTFHFYRGKEKVEHLGVSFWCRYKSGKIKIDPQEHTEYRWVAPEEALLLITDNSARRAIKLFIQAHK